jgi:hypothetical protein
MSRELAIVLRQLYCTRQEVDTRRDRGEILKWVFVNGVGRPIGENRPRKIFPKILVHAALQKHTVYDLRHTFATLHLSKGHPITYVAHNSGILRPVPLYGGTRIGFLPTKGDMQTRLTLQTQRLASPELRMLAIL